MDINIPIAVNGNQVGISSIQNTQVFGGVFCTQRIISGTQNTVEKKVVSCVVINNMDISTRHINGRVVNTFRCSVDLNSISPIRTAVGGLLIPNIESIFVKSIISGTYIDHSGSTTTKVSFRSIKTSCNY